MYDGRVEDTLRSEGMADLLERVQWNSSHRTREGATEKRSEAEEEKDEEEEGEGGRKEREKLENITEFSEQGKYFHPESATPDVVSINEGLFTSPLHGDPESGVSAETVAKRSELYQLRRELHQLEEKCRALLEEKTRSGGREGGWVEGDGRREGREGGGREGGKEGRREGGREGGEAGGREDRHAGGQKEVERAEGGRYGRMILRERGREGGREGERAREGERERGREGERERERGREGGREVYKWHTHSNPLLAD